MSTFRLGAPVFQAPSITVPWSTLMDPRDMHVLVNDEPFYPRCTRTSGDDSSLGCILPPGHGGQMHLDFREAEPTAATDAPRFTTWVDSVYRDEFHRRLPG